MEDQTNKSGMSTGAIIGIAVIVALVFGGGAYAYVNNKAEKEKKDLNAQITQLQSQVSSGTTATTVPSSSTSATADATANWTSYANTKYGYSFKYPATVKLTASKENSDDLAINATADGVNVFPSTGTVGNGIFFVAVPNIDFTTTAIKNQFGATKAENIATTSMTIAGANSYKVVISGDNSVVSTFYFIKSPSGTVLELTVLNSSSDAQNILASFQFTK